MTNEPQRGFIKGKTMFHGFMGTNQDGSKTFYPVEEPFEIKFTEPTINANEGGEDSTQLDWNPTTDQRFD